MPIDNATKGDLEAAVCRYGMRPVLDYLTSICDHCAEVSVEQFHTMHGKQWAAWSVAIEALRDNRKLTDPGRE